MHISNKQGGTNWVLQLDRAGVGLRPIMNVVTLCSKFPTHCPPSSSVAGEFSCS
jgi:hypothetical protein